MRRAAAASNHLSTAFYDAASNVIANGDGQTFSYDAENRQTSIGGTLSGSYVYDGEGHRTQKVVGGITTTNYVYDSAGRLTADYSTTTGTQRCDVLRF
jgi:YD repeat-containing protein